MMLTPFRALKANDFPQEPVASLLATSMLISCLVQSSTLKMNAMRSSETSVYVPGTRQYYVPEDRTLYNHCCEDLKSYVRNFLHPIVTRGSVVVPRVRYLMRRFLNLPNPFGQTRLCSLLSL
jgi:Fe2+ transport system protein B